MAFRRRRGRRRLGRSSSRRNFSRSRRKIRRNYTVARGGIRL